MSMLSAFWDAWKNRHKLGDKDLEHDLAAFLPAALEIQKTPPNPIAKWLSRSLIILFVGGISWAMIGEVDIVASAEGKIIPSSRVKHIQPLQKAIVKKILVKEGELVTKGQPLIELDSTLTHADEKRAESEVHSMQTTLASHQSFLSLLEYSLFDQYKLRIENISFDESLDLNETEYQLQQKLVWEKWQEYFAQLKTLRNSLNKNQAEQAETKATINKHQRALPLLTQRVNKLKELLPKKYIPEIQYLELEQQRVEQVQELVAERHRLDQLLAAFDETQEQIYSLQAQTRANTLQAITEVQQQHKAMQEELTKAADLNSRQILYAPVSGQIQELAITTIGGVVTEAQQLMLIVPNEEKLEVEVFLQNKDIGFVKENMPAEIKIHTFPFTKYGVIEGNVKNISDDATVDEQQGLIYAMHVQMDRNTISVDNKEVKLIPGMAVTAEMKTGKRKIIEYFLAPLLRYRSESIRER